MRIFCIRQITAPVIQVQQVEKDKITQYDPSAYGKQNRSKRTGEK